MRIRRAIGLGITIIVLRFLAPHAWQSIDRALMALADAAATLASAGAAAVAQL